MFLAKLRTEARMAKPPVSHYMVVGSHKASSGMKTTNNMQNSSTSRNSKEPLTICIKSKPEICSNTKAFITT